MSYHLIIQYPYETIQIALCQNGIILDSVIEHKFQAIALTIPHMQQLLTNNNLTLNDISFIGINRGPAPYNTLRALLSMVNGVHFVNKTPLVELTALELLEKELNEKHSLIVLKAFMNHVFYRYKNENSFQENATSIEELITFINQQPYQLTIVGNGALEYQKILTLQTDKLIFPAVIPAFNNLEILASESYKKFKEKAIAQNYVQPLYFDQL